ncbi:unnamed protein product, partial [marine sediment metagenome]
VHPNAPSWLEPLAKKQWRKIAKELFNLGLLTNIDLSTLEAYCQCYARWRNAEEKSKVTVFKENEKVIQNPYISIALRYLKEMRHFITEFGMSPAARTRVEISNNESGEGEDLD